MTAYKKKLIEVALPLDAINEEASRRKRKAPAGYPTTLHKWWAQRPLAAARAVIFSQMVDDPSEYVETLLDDPRNMRVVRREFNKRREAWKAAADPGPQPTLKECAADLERQRLFGLIEELVKWENSTNQSVLERARAEIWQSWRRACADNADHPRATELFDRFQLPAFHDPFAGGGSLPLEAQRLGLEAYATDLNPVAVLITKGLIEIPPRFAGRSPVNPEAQLMNGLIDREWRGAEGLAADVRYYGEWVRNEAAKRIGHLYPKVMVTADMVERRPDLKAYRGRELTVIAWLWARTVRSPNPAFAHVEVPLASTFMLSTKKGKEAYVEPVIDDTGYRFTVKIGRPNDVAAAKNGTKLSRGAFQCLMSGLPFQYSYIDDEANAGRMGERLMAIVAAGDRSRVYLDPSPEHETGARIANPTWKPDTQSRGTWASNAQGRRYGFHAFSDYFTSRQLVALTTFSELVHEAHELAKRDGAARGLSRDGLRDAVSEVGAYASAIATYLSMAVSRMADYGSSICTWRPKDNAMRSTLSKQAIQMAWDFAEGSPFGDSSSGFCPCVEVVARVIDTVPATGVGVARQANVHDVVLAKSGDTIVSTDPPYYANVGYADLSDFFYVWLRRFLRPLFPELFATLAVPKAEELIATPYRHGSKEAAEHFFLDGMTKAMRRVAEQVHPGFPVTIYYALKQSETEGGEGTASTGWETFLEAVIGAGFAISGTWPMRTEGDNRQIGIGANALASSIVLVCRPRKNDGKAATRREFLSALKADLPVALKHLQRSNIAPVDLAQAAIGPGMEVYTRFDLVLESDGSRLSVRAALAIINQVLDETISEQEGDFDADSRWAVAWFEQHGFDSGDYGVAETLSKAKNTSVKGLDLAGILKQGRGKVRLIPPDELPDNWDPGTDSQITAWECVHHLIRALRSGGESAAAELVLKLGGIAEIARELAYRLYTICERKKWAEQALGYNGIVQSWPEIMRLTREASAVPGEVEQDLFG